MAKLKSANGQMIDFDAIRLKNEDVIALGNMKVNARGDLLGAGGKIVKTRDQVMKDYYALNTPVAIDELREQNPVLEPVRSPPVGTIPTRPAAPIVTEVEEPLSIAGSGFDDEDLGPPDIMPIEKATRPMIVQTPVPHRSPPASEPVTTIATAVNSDDEVLVPTPTIRGSLASAVAKTSTTTQKEKLPPKKANGIQRF